MGLFLSQLHGFNVRRGTPDVVMTFVGYDQDGPATTYTFGPFAITAGQTCVVSVHGRRSVAGNPFPVNSVDIGGFSATKLKDNTSLSNREHVSIWGAATTGLTSVSVDVTFYTTSSGGYLGFYALSNLQSLSVADSGVATNATSTTSIAGIDVPAGGVIIAAATNAGSNKTATWADPTETYDGGKAAFSAFGAADQYAVATTVTASVTSSSNNNDLVVVALR